MTGSPVGRVVTLTANPSLDRTLELPGPLLLGGVVRLTGSATSIAITSVPSTLLNRCSAAHFRFGRN